MKNKDEKKAEMLEIVRESKGYLKSNTGIAGIYDDKCDKVVFDRQIKDRFGVYGEISLEDLLKGKKLILRFYQKSNKNK